MRWHLVVTSLSLLGVSLAAEPLAIGSRLELFVDHYLIDSLEGARLRLQAPRLEGPAIRFDRPWEGRFAGYVTIIRDEPAKLYRMYYRGLPKAGGDGSAIESTCYAESDDGVTWRKPALGLFEVQGTKDNNVILKGFAPASHNFSPFLDSNPDCPPDARYKALGGGGGGLFAFVSPDGIRWRRIHDEPRITKGAFDSQNVSFWSEVEKRYLCYFRTWDGFRSVSRATSTDFLHWDEPVAMSYGDSKREHLYTNQTHAYARAPHLYVGVAARFWPGRRVLSPEQARAIDVDPGYFGDISDSVLLTSRGGHTYTRTFMESFIRPGRDGLENWVSRTNYPALGIVPTGEGELSLWVQKNYGQPSSRLDRYSMRVDGFASVNGPYAGGELTTKPLVFAAASAAEVAARRAAWVAVAPPPGLAREREGGMHGKGSLRIREPVALTLPGTQKLGRSFTLAAHLRDVPAGHRRLFSAYDGGSTRPGEIILDFNSGGAIEDGDSLRFYWNGQRLGAPFAKVGAWDDDAMHHLALVFDAGMASIYLDGREVASGRLEGEVVELRLGDLQLGEDYPGTQQDNEPLLGRVDDVLVLRRALAREEITALAERGASALAARPAAGDLLLSMEGQLDGALENAYGDGEPSTVPLAAGSVFPEEELILNYATSAAGSVRVEIQTADGTPIPGFALEDCPEHIGDFIERPVTWRAGSDVSRLRGRPIRLRFVLRDADLYSLRFR